MLDNCNICIISGLASVDCLFSFKVRISLLLLVIGEIPAALQASTDKSMAGGTGMSHYSSLRVFSQHYSEERLYGLKWKSWLSAKPPLVPLQCDVEGKKTYFLNIKFLSVIKKQQKSVLREKNSKYSINKNDNFNKKLHYYAKSCRIAIT